MSVKLLAMGKACRVKQRTYTKKKKRFHGNQHTKVRTLHQEPQHQQLPALVINEVGENVSTPSSQSSAINGIWIFPCPPKVSESASKVEPIITDTPKQTDTQITGYRLIDV